MLQNLLKHIPLATWLVFLPVLMGNLASWLKSKDENNTGGDDAFGDIVLAAIPAVENLDPKNESKLVVAVKAVRDSCDAWLKLPRSADSQPVKPKAKAKAK